MPLCGLFRRCMGMNTFSIGTRLCCRFLFVVSVTLLVYPAYGLEPTRTSDTYTLKNLFEDTWSRQPEAKAYATRLESLQARQKVSQSLVARPPTLELGGKGEKTLRISRNVTGHFTRT